MNTRNQNVDGFLAKPWGDPQSIVPALLEHGLIRHDPSGQLPLKKGGTTDLYVNLRDHRKSPQALRWLAAVYGDALECLDDALFDFEVPEVGVVVDVPAAMSPAIGVIAADSERRILTVRDVPKPGRLHAEYIGSLELGDQAIILDDVITDGESKRQPIELLRSLGVEPLAIMVLVDRDDGWRETPEATAFMGVPVFAGMRLADLRAALQPS